MQQLFLRNAPAIFMVAGTLYGLMLYVNVPRGGNETVFIATIIMLGGFFFAGRVIHQLYEKAYTDSLTGLKSRAAFEPVQEKRKANSDEVSALLMVDADDFKRINDQYGHRAGDAALKSLASILRKSVRDKDSVFRWGGDEFVVILPDASAENAGVVAERIRSAVEGYGLYDLTVSIGIAGIVDNNVGAALAAADKAMYGAKERKNAIVTYAAPTDRLPPNPANYPPTEPNPDMIWVQ
jgi:diguanylate cyclase (GGDEF)-like protein